MLEFLRSDIVDLQAYTPHPGGAVTTPLDRLDTNESPYDLPPDLQEKLAWMYQNTIETNRYPDGSHAALKAAIAQYASESAGGMVSLDPSQISVGNGSDELIRSLLIATCLNSVCSILVATPTFSMYGILAQTLGIPITSVNRHPDNFAIHLGEAEYALEQNPLIRVVFVVHPNSPTANQLTSDEINWLRQLPSQLLVVIDEAYFEFSGETLLAELEEHPNWIILRTFSKAFRLAALRVGYAIAHPQLTLALEKIRLPYNLPAFSQGAALLALENRQELLSCISTIQQERDRLYQAFQNIPQLRVWPSDANFLYLRLEDHLASRYPYPQLIADLKAQGTLIRHTGGGLRITVGTPEENSRTLERLSALLQGQL
ncbi:MAG: histidinol-phosphate transaminase [Jaaginema sp. PMC 1079.18]|nr:histidinol-phosphate transaminase [Jaaginema sp. PMC 1080.18]MEC4853933.1 histidinol-phosphate transaminase [Jaaginema sp. PMC 1079.18]MEC4869154.1 histidinol-phosphate transaminase [Jaaginema sp. PMC 1078.18]